MPQITFINETQTLCKTLEVEPGTSVLEAAQAGGVVIETPCNALGLCGKCRVHAEDRTSEILACQTRIFEDLQVLVPDYAAENRSLSIITAGTSFSYPKAPFITKKLSGDTTQVYGGEELLGTEPGDTRSFLYGVVDIGTTTLVSSLVDLHTGKELASHSILNPQTRYAQDVISRIRFAEQGLATLYQVFMETLHTQIAEMTAQIGISPEQIYETVYSGNTVMLHLATNTDPSSLGQYPYAPRIRGGNHISGAELGISPFGLIYLPPIISSFVGSDITSGILAARLEELPGVSLFIDIGTNGEMVLAKDGSLASSSTAAGPAFEGMNISCGMRANRGAVEAFSIDAEGEPTFTVIGAGLPVGICGSGLIDLGGELVRTGVIQGSGRFVPPDQGDYALKKYMGQREGQPAFLITPEVYLSQRDIRQIQLAKGAIRGGIAMLLAHFNLSPQGVDRVLIAGSFGYHLNEKSLLNLGLLPRDFAGKVSFVGNTSLSGGTGFLLNTGFRERMSRTVKKIRSVELAQGPEFEELFIQFLSFSED